MGYTTSFEGRFTIEPPLTAEQIATLRTLADESPRAGDGKPDNWLQWTPSADGKTLGWDGGEKFYHYKQWLTYLIRECFAPWGCMLNGVSEWQGESVGDAGRLVVENNVVRVQKARWVDE